MKWLIQVASVVAISSATVVLAYRFLEKRGCVPNDYATKGMDEILPPKNDSF